MKKKIFKIAGIFLGVVIIFISLLWVYSYYQIKNTDYFKYQDEWYTREEFEDLIKKNQENPETKNTPKEAYEKFYQAVLEKNTDKALEYVTESQRIQYHKILSQRMEKLNKTLPEPEKIYPNQNRMYENSANYYYHTSDGSEVRTISFKKDLDGYWRIDYF